MTSGGSMLWKCWLQQVKRLPEHPAMIDASTGEIASFLFLTQQAMELAGQFDASLKKCAVAFCFKNSIDWMIAFLVLQMSDAVALPMDAGTPMEVREERARLLGASFFLKGKTLIPLRKRRKYFPEGICLLKSTSGSTGLPKALPCDAKHMMADGRNVASTMGIIGTDKHLALIPFGHSYGLGNLVMPLLLQGTPLVYATEFVVSQIPEWIKQYHITVFPSVPIVLHALAMRKGRDRLSPLRTIISAGAPLSTQIAQKFKKRYGLLIHNFYGSSETGGICYDRSGEASLTGSSIGTPLDRVKVRILKDRRIEVRSRAVAHPSGKYVLPDYGRWNDQQELCLEGRVGDAANIGGRKVFPSEMEYALLQIREVREARVIVRRKRRDMLVAFVETDLSQPALLVKLRDRIPSWMFPKRWVLSKSLPRNARGKLDLHALEKSV